MTAAAFELTPDGGGRRSAPRAAPLSRSAWRTPAGRWRRCQEGLSQRLQEAGLYEPEKRPFWPHVTAGPGEARRRGRRAASRRSPTCRLGSAGPFRATRVTLFRWTLKPSGAVYEPLASAVH